MTPEEFQAKYPLTYRIMANIAARTKAPQGELDRLVRQVVQSYTPTQIARIEAAADDVGAQRVDEIMHEVHTAQGSPTFPNP